MNCIIQLQKNHYNSIGARKREIKVTNNENNFISSFTNYDFNSKKDHINLQFLKVKDKDEIFKTRI